MNIEMNYVNLDMHVPDIKRTNRVIKERFRIAYYRISYKKFLKLIRYLAMVCTKHKTHVPSTSPSSDFLNADRGDLLIRGFWEGSTDTIIDVRVTNLDSKSYKNLPPKKALERQEKEKKKKYCKPCENQRRHFTPFVVSTDGIFGFEARAFLKRLAKLLAEEWEKPYPTVGGFINTRMSIALVRATNRCIRDSRIPVSSMSNRFCWEGGAGLGLLKSDN